MKNYDKRLECMEHATFTEDQNMVLVFLHPGEDEAAKVAEAKLEHGLGEDDSGRILVIQFVAVDGATEKLNSAIRLEHK